MRAAKERFKRDVERERRRTLLYSSKNTEVKWERENLVKVSYSIQISLLLFGLKFQKVLTVLQNESNLDN